MAYMRLVGRLAGLRRICLPSALREAEETARGTLLSVETESPPYLCTGVKTEVLNVQLEAWPAAAAAGRENSMSNPSLSERMARISKGAASVGVSRSSPRQVLCQDQLSEPP